MALPVGKGGGLRGTKIVNKYFVNKRAFPSVSSFMLSQISILGSSVLLLLRGD